MTHEPVDVSNSDTQDVCKLEKVIHQRSGVAFALVASHETLQQACCAHSSVVQSTVDKALGPSSSVLC